MLKIFSAGLATALFLLVFMPASHAFATEGTCSSHGGVNCSIGPDWDASAICNDGWNDSGEKYFQQIECQQVTMCSEADWTQMSSTYTDYNLPKNAAAFYDLITAINALNADYPLIEIRDEQAAQGRGITTSGLAPQISADQRANRDSVATKVSAAYTLDANLRTAQLAVNKICIANAVAAREFANAAATRQTQSVVRQPSYIQPAPIIYTPQDINIGTLPGISQDERCMKLNLGQFYNTDKQSCDVCPSGTARVVGTNVCQQPISAPQKVEITKREVQSAPLVKTQDIKRVEFRAVATTTVQTTTLPTQANPPAPKPKTFLGKVTSPFRSLWGWLFNK